MAAYKMAAVKVTPPNDFPLGLIRSYMVVIHLFLMLCDLQRVVRDLCPTLYVLHVLINMDHYQGDRWVPSSDITRACTRRYTQSEQDTTSGFVYARINKLLSLYLFFVVYRCKIVDNRTISVVTVTMSM